MRTLLILLLTFFSAACMAQDGFPERYLIADRYTQKRIKLQEGDPIWFKLKGEDLRLHDYIGRLHKDSIYLYKRQMSIAVSEISTLYFERNGLRQVFKMGTTFIGGGFLFSAAVHPLMKAPRYSQKEAFILGSSFFAISRILGLFRVKKFHLNENSRLRVMHMTPTSS